MQARKWVVSVAAAVALGGGLVSTAQAQSSVTVPVAATLQVYEWLTQDASRCPYSTPYLPYITGNIWGGGFDRYLGNVQVSAVDCPVPIGTNWLPQGFNVTAGRMMLVTASGDQIHISYSGQMQMLPPTPTAPVLYGLNGQFTVTGGTGCFTRSVGRGTLTGTFDVYSAIGRYQANGSIVQTVGYCGRTGLTAPR